ncbi:MAG: hypothetical protein Q9218_004965 [Villophora microphyllina]
MRSPACRPVGVLLPTIARLSSHYHVRRSPTIFRRTFSSNPRLLKKKKPPEVPGPTRNPSLDLPPCTPGESPNDPPPEKSSGGPSDPPEKPTKPIDKANYGSASRRAGRNLKKPQDLLPPDIPPTFLRRNVVLREVLQQALTDSEKTAALHPGIPTDRLVDGYKDVRPLTKSSMIRIRGGKGLQGYEQQMDQGLVAGKIDASVMQEIESNIRAYLKPSNLSSEESKLTKPPHLLLHCPKLGATGVLNALTENLAAMNNADLIRITATDIAEIGGGYMDEMGDDQGEALGLLGYDVCAVQDSSNSQDHRDEEDPEEAGEEADEEGHGEEEHGGPGTSFPFPAAQGFVIRLDAKALSSIANTFKNKRPLGIPTQKLSDHIRDIVGAPVKDSTRELRLSLLLDTLLNVSDAKRATEDANKGNEIVESDQRPVSAAPIDSPGPPMGQNSRSSPLIIQVTDYPEICSTRSGDKVMDALHDTLYERRKEGQRIVLVGTCASEDRRLTSESRSRQWNIDMARTKTIMVPAIESTKGSFRRYHRQQVIETNIQHILLMLASSIPQDQHAKLVRDIRGEDDMGPLNLGKSANGPDSVRRADRFYAAILEPLSPNRVHRIVTVLSGMINEDNEMTLDHLFKASEVVEMSDRARDAWIDGEQSKERRPDEAQKIEREQSKGRRPDKERKKERRLHFNTHERRLLPGVVDAGSLRTNFHDVQVPEKTIETLKTLTSLSLQRPDAFTYGVLATDQIPGVLLYGPPGTGKTLLAKAVAKESGATILEISGAEGLIEVVDIHDKYVGESEKNIRAIFTLARKLKPCVVFIDEADALLGSRNDSANSLTHRTVLNQFLREWDGLKELSAFIMVATNRPFDLDEASLRRLPRRMLIDLPTEKDREAILRIHLKDEQLDPEISLAKLASETPLYSGSDLKNLAVAAALACVKEEFDVARDSTSGSRRPAGQSGSPEVPPPTSATSDHAAGPGATGVSAPHSDSSAPPSGPSAPPTLATPPDIGTIPSMSSSRTPPTSSGTAGQLDASAATEPSIISAPITGLQSSLADVRRKMHQWITLRTSHTSSSSDSPCPVSQETQGAQDISSSLPPFSSVAPASSPPPATEPPTPTQIDDMNSFNASIPSKPTDSAPSPPSPPRRILRPHHFTHALQEITPSISEDMASLKAIKKFDAKYGDRRGRKKKLGGGYGFSKDEPGEQRASIRAEG